MSHELRTPLNAAATLRRCAGWYTCVDTRSTASLDAAFIVMGLSIGVGQWLLLRRRLRRAGWWIAANGAGWGLLALIAEGNAIGQLGLVAFGVLPACATALVLALLMNQVRRAEPHGV